MGALEQLGIDKPALYVGARCKGVTINDNISKDIGPDLSYSRAVL